MWANSNPWEVDFERISALKWKSHQIDHVTEQILFYKHYLMPICPILLNVTHFKYYKIIINCNKLPSVTQTLWHKFSDFETLWESFFGPALSQSNVLQCCLNSEKGYSRKRPMLGQSGRCLVESGRCQSGRCWVKAADVGAKVADVWAKAADVSSAAFLAQSGRCRLKAADVP